MARVPSWQALLWPWVAVRIKQAEDWASRILSRRDAGVYMGLRVKIWRWNKRVKQLKLVCKNQWFSASGIFFLFNTAKFRTCFAKDDQAGCYMWFYNTELNYDKHFTQGQSLTFEVTLHSVISFVRLIIKLRTKPKFIYSCTQLLNLLHRN